MSDSKKLYNDIMPKNFPRSHAIDKAILKDVDKRFSKLINDLCEGFGLTRLELFLILIDFLEIRVKAIQNA